MKNSLNFRNPTCKDPFEGTLGNFILFFLKTFILFFLKTFLKFPQEEQNLV